MFVCCGLKLWQGARKVVETLASGPRVPINARTGTGLVVDAAGAIIKTADGLGRALLLFVFFCCVTDCYALFSHCAAASAGRRRIGGSGQVDERQGHCHQWCVSIVVLFCSDVLQGLASIKAIASGDVAELDRVRRDNNAGHNGLPAQVSSMCSVSLPFAELWCFSSRATRASSSAARPPGVASCRRWRMDARRWATALWAVLAMLWEREPRAHPSPLRIGGTAVECCNQRNRRTLPLRWRFRERLHLQ